MRSSVFSAIFAAYCILSFLGFLFSSAGWISVFWLYYGGGYFLVLVALVLVTHITSMALKTRIIVGFPALLLAIIFALQILLVLFNPGDCGDNLVKGESNYSQVRFLERAMTGFTDFCQIDINTTTITNFVFHSAFTTFATSLALLYFPLLLSLVSIYIWTVWQKYQETHARQQRADNY